MITQEQYDALGEGDMVVALVAELAAERAKVQQLREALLEAAADVEDYARYAGEYLVQKWHIADDVARYRALAGEGN